MTKLLWTIAPTGADDPLIENSKVPKVTCCAQIHQGPFHSLIVFILKGEILFVEFTIDHHKIVAFSGNHVYYYDFPRQPTAFTRTIETRGQTGLLSKVLLEHHEYPPSFLTSYPFACYHIPCTKIVRLQ